MPSHVIDTPVAWDADEPLHAHVTRVAVQGNLQAAYDFSGSDLDGGILRLSGGRHTITPGGTWAWSDLKPVTLRMLRRQGNTAWRDINVEVLGELSAPGATTLRAFILPGVVGAADPDPVTGLIGDYDYADLQFVAAALERKSNPVTPSTVYTFTLLGIEVPVAWLRFAVAGNKDLYVYSVRIQEGT